MAKPAQIKTKVNEASVEDFLKGLKNEQQRKDSEVILKLMKNASGLEPKLWGTAIIGFGIKRYKSPASGREVDWFLIGFSPRKANISLHLVLDLKQQSALLKTLGKFKAGVGCLYINKLEDVDVKILEKLIQAALKGK